MHAYIPIRTLNDVAPGYAMYTYVLTGVRLDRIREGSNVLSRMKALLDAIETTTATSHELQESGAPIEETNLFCIPATARTKSSASSGARARSSRAPIQDEIDLKQYNSALAVIYLSLASQRITDEAARRHLSGEGPFLVSFLKPIEKVTGGASVLLTDLSATNSKAMSTVVDAYKQRISTALTETQVFNPIKLQLLNIILNSDEYVRIEQVAIASVLGKSSKSENPLTKERQ